MCPGEAKWPERRNGRRSEMDWTAVHGRLQVALAEASWHALDVWIPPVCPLCGGDLLSHRSERLCRACQGRIATPSARWCMRCAEPLPDGVQPFVAGCPRCARTGYHFARVLPPLGIYRTTLRDAIVRMKRPSETPLIWAMGCLLADRLERTIQAEGIDLVTQVPKHWWRRHSSQQDTPRLLANCRGE